MPTRGRSVEAKSAGGGFAPARTPIVQPASGGYAPARVPTSASGSNAPARGSRPDTPTQGHYFYKFIPCGLSWGSHDLPGARCSTCQQVVTIFLGTEVRPPVRPPPSRSNTPTPPPAPVRPAKAAVSPGPTRGGNVPARGKGVPTPPPAPMRAGGKGTGGRQVFALEAALAAPMPFRTPEGSLQRARSEQDQVGGPVATKARTLAPPNVIFTPARDVAALRDFVSPPGETLEEITRLSRYNSVHCGSCHRLSPIGSFKCGFCDFAFLTARDPTRRVPEPTEHGLDREMLRAPSRGAEQRRGHTRPVSGDERKRLKKLRIHIQKWDNDPEYRVRSSRLGMIRGQYNTRVVGPWLAVNADDTPPPQPDTGLPLGIPAAATVIA